MKPFFFGSLDVDGRIVRPHAGMSSIAEQMGYTLQNTSSSVNMKERLDFSCAIFEPKEGALVANAPHVPVHLGSMGESVRSVIRRNQVHHILYIEFLEIVDIKAVEFGLWL